MKKVVILGGGVAGMSAAHELIERGFDVEVYEKQPVYVGGKARSVNVPGTNNQHPDMYLPGEHGFRFFPGFYKHVIDTMKRTPQSIVDGKPSKASCYDNLVDTETIKICQPDGRPDIVFPTDFFGSWKNIKMLYQLYKNRAVAGLKSGEGVFFGKLLLQFMCSGLKRRNDQYEKTAWWDYTDVANHSEAYRYLLAVGVTRTLVAADAKVASTKTDGNIILQLVFNFINPTVRTDRIFNQPTNDAWLSPWHKYLVAKGVKYNQGYWFTGFNLSADGKSIASVSVNNYETGVHQDVTADYYVLAIPADKAAELTGKLVPLDARLAGLQSVKNNMQWMTGMQFYLNKEVKINPGHVNYAFTWWSLTSIDQMSFWKNYDLSKRGHGNVKSILSVDISNWQLQYGRNVAAADDQTNFDDIMEGVWQQLKQNINKPGQEILTDDMRVDYYLDMDIITTDQRIQQFGKNNVSGPLLNYNKEQMVINTVNSWKDRPDAVTNIPNLFLASDYIRTNTDFACMESANEAGRTAVNGILDASGSSASKCQIWKLEEPALFAPVKWYDDMVYSKSKKAFSVPWWLKILMIPWIITWTVYFTMKILIFKLLGLKPQ